MTIIVMCFFFLCNYFLLFSLFMKFLLLIQFFLFTIFVVFSLHIPLVSFAHSILKMCSYVFVLGLVTSSTGNVCYQEMAVSILR